MFPPSVYTSQDPVTGTCTFTLEFIYNFFVIFQYTTSPRDSNPLSLVVYHEFCAQASNILKYNFFVILKHTTKRHLNGYPELYKSSNVLQYIFFVILKHTNDMGNWISLSNRTNFGNVFQYNFSLRFLSQDCGLLSPCNMIVLGVVLARKLYN